MKRIILALATAGMLAACGTADQSPDATVERVAAAAFREGGAPTITVITMVNNRTGSGGHTALKVKGSQTVIFDPAGSFRAPSITERGDVLYGMSPKWVRAYKSAHARSTHHVVSQEITVTPAQAEQALRLVQARGSVPGAYCANATTGIMQQVQGFQNIKQTFYPVQFMEQFATLPGVRTTKLYEDDEGGVIDAARAAKLVAAKEN